MPLHPTLTLLAALKARLEAIQWTPSGGGAENLFQKVHYYSEPDLIKALSEIRVLRDRTCLIVPDNNHYGNDINGPSMTTSAERGVILVIADRDYGSGQDALIGDASRPGVLVIEEQVVADITGRNLGIRGVRVRPDEGHAMEIAPNDEKKIPGRKVRTLQLTIEAGEMLTTLNS